MPRIVVEGLLLLIPLPPPTGLADDVDLDMFVSTPIDEFLLSISFIVRKMLGDDGGNRGSDTVINKNES